MGIAWVMSDGSTVFSYPFLFEERENLKLEAMALAANLKYTKKLSGSDFTECWLDDLQVINYRKLLKRIWEFKTDISVISKIPKCDRCDKTEDLFEMDVTLRDGFVCHNEVNCKDCLDERIRIFDDWKFDYKPLESIR